MSHVINIPKVVVDKNQVSSPTQITVSNNGFFPDIELIDVRHAMRADGTVTDERLKFAVIEAMATVNAELHPLQAEYATFDDIPSDHINGENLMINQSLANQLEQANQHILQYQKQMDKLHKQVLDKLTQAEERTNEILLELENNQSWSHQPVPTGVSRLLNQRSGTVSNSKANSAHLSPNKTVPQSQVRDKNQR